MIQVVVQGQGMYVHIGLGLLVGIPWVHVHMGRWHTPVKVPPMHGQGAHRGAAQNMITIPVGKRDECYCAR